MMKKILFAIMVLVLMFALTACVEESAPQKEIEDIDIPIEDKTFSFASVESTYITKGEVAQHNYKTDCWVAYNGYVYDVSLWIPHNEQKVVSEDDTFRYLTCGNIKEAAQYLEMHNSQTKISMLLKRSEVVGELA